MHFPTAPTDLVTGVIVYQHADYTGASAHITSDVDKLEDYKGRCLKSKTDSNRVHLHDRYLGRLHFVDTCRAGVGRITLSR